MRIKTSLFIKKVRRSKKRRDIWKNGEKIKRMD
jgi:hypothetical protein